MVFLITRDEEDEEDDYDDDFSEEEEEEEIFGDDLVSAFETLLQAIIHEIMRFFTLNGCSQQIGE